MPLWSDTRQYLCWNVHAASCSYQRFKISFLLLSREPGLTCRLQPKSHLSQASVPHWPPLFCCDVVVHVQIRSALGGTTTEIIIITVQGERWQLEREGGQRLPELLRRLNKVGEGHQVIDNTAPLVKEGGRLGHEKSLTFCPNLSFCLWTQAEWILSVTWTQHNLFNHGGRVGFTTLDYWHLSIRNDKKR